MNAASLYSWPNLLQVSARESAQLFLKSKPHNSVFSYQKFIGIAPMEILRDAPPVRDAGAWQLLRKEPSKTAPIEYKRLIDCRNKPP